MCPIPKYPRDARLFENCPNLESLTFGRGFVQLPYTTIGSRCVGLKRVRGVDVMHDSNVECESPKVPSNRKESPNEPLL